MQVTVATEAELPGWQRLPDIHPAHCFRSVNRLLLFMHEDRAAASEFRQ
jgi:hypothetical protein